jgi:hypothetical protein
LDQYDIKPHDFPASHAALMLHPCYRLRHFGESWKGPLAKYLAPMKKILRALHSNMYKSTPTERHSEGEKGIFDMDMDELLVEYLTYIRNTRKGSHF